MAAVFNLYPFLTADAVKAVSSGMVPIIKLTTVSARNEMCQTIKRGGGPIKQSALAPFPLTRNRNEFSLASYAWTRPRGYGA